MYGRFSGNPRTEWLPEAGADRRMLLLEDFWYTDPDGRTWVAPAGSVIDGASIPAPLWSTIGSPYTGEYRRASIVHDVACADARVNRREADRMFYFACQAGGCSRLQAELLYAGVRIGAWAPDIRLWSGRIARPLLARGRTQPGLTDQSVRTTFQEIAADLEALRPDEPFAAVADIVDRHLAAKAAQ
ncbi:DUF1353 domain-containing protein [Hymenobacter latericus]|uniref:DUF1353 domain-containing protein n=1 Tax=Hymenobacter sp. YIM 151858-1 TaxID=2987688 RepID=UPI002226F951|nr:DUF1353 domain-containing protein [Hymenobacter sp. YIM 151858-1]UYZ57577.1 DUF1353 domain-containing protein [Hymenobacter sp. YIM 151858-1]